METTKCVFWKLAIKFVLQVPWKFASILRRFPIIHGYPLQWDFPYDAPKIADLGRSIRPRWTNFVASISHFSVHCRLLVDMAHIVHFLGHVTRFHGNRCLGNQKKYVFWKPGHDFLYLVNITLFRVSHRFCVRPICNFCLQLDFPFSGATLPHFGP